MGTLKKTKRGSQNTDNSRHWPIYFHWANNVLIFGVLMCLLYLIIVHPDIASEITPYVLFLLSVLAIIFILTKPIKIPDNMELSEARHFVIEEVKNRKNILKKQIRDPVWYIAGTWAVIGFLIWCLK